MADITYTLDATQRKVGKMAGGKGEGHSVKALVATVNVTTSTSVTRTIKFGTIPSNARILPSSKVYNDDLATTGSPTLDIGLASVDSNVTSDADALLAGHSLSAASTGTSVLADHANSGLPAWDFINGQSADPKGLLDVYGSILDASTTDAGDITLELFYTLD